MKLANKGYNWDSVVQMTDKELIHTYAWVTGPFYRKSKPAAPVIVVHSAPRRYLNTMYPDLKSSFEDMSDSEIADIFGDCFYTAE